MDTVQIVFLAGALLCFTGLGFMMYYSIRKHEANSKQKKKGGKSRYIPKAKKNDTK